MLSAKWCCSLSITRRFEYLATVREGKVEWVHVRKGMGMKDKLEIFGALEEGDQLLSRANDELKEGRSVAVK